MHDFPPIITPIGDKVISEIADLVTGNASNNDWKSQDYKI